MKNRYLSLAYKLCSKMFIFWNYLAKYSCFWNSILIKLSYKWCWAWFWNLNRLMNQKRERFKILEVKSRFNWGQTVTCYLIFLIYLILKIGLNLLIFHSWPTRYAWPNGLHTGHVISWLRSGSSPANSIFSSVLSKIMTWMNWLLIELALGPLSVNPIRLSNPV